MYHSKLGGVGYISKDNIYIRVNIPTGVLSLRLNLLRILRMSVDFTKSY